MILNISCVRTNKHEVKELAVGHETVADFRDLQSTEPICIEVVIRTQRKVHLASAYALAALNEEELNMLMSARAETILLEN